MNNDQKQGQVQNTDKGDAQTPGNIQENANEMDANISNEEMAMLDNLDTNSEGDDADRVFLDNTDAEGIKLEEKSSASSASGEDLDVPGAELDDADEEIGEEDEENNAYSQADTE